MCGWIPIEVDDEWPCRCVVVDCPHLATFATIGILGMVWVVGEDPPTHEWDGVALCTEHYYELGSGEELFDDQDNPIHE